MWRLRKSASGLPRSWSRAKRLALRVSLGLKERTLGGSGEGHLSTLNLSPKGVISRHDLDMFVPLVCASPYCLGQEQILGAEDYRVTGERIRYATFYNFWGGSRISPKAFRTRLREDLTTLLDLLAADRRAVSVD
jgi:hypothetical protein